MTNHPEVDPDQRDEALAWRRVSREQVGDHRVFRVEHHRALHPRTGETHTFSVIDAPDWVNVVAVTDDARVVLVRQFRHGTGEVGLEIPGGMVDPGEDDRAAAIRELREETGYTAARWLRLGSVEPNPALQGNRCATWLALDATPGGAPSGDPDEVIAVETLALADIPRALASGEIRHALVVCGLYWYLAHAGGWALPPG